MFLSVIFLCAGSSVRMGKQKQLMNYSGVPLFKFCLNKYLKSDADEIILVTGANSQNILDSIDKHKKLKTIHNENYLNGIGTSISKGLSAVSPLAEGCMIALADMPYIYDSLINELIVFWRNNSKYICSPVVGSNRKNPVIFPKQLFELLKKLDSDRGGAKIISENKHLLKTYEVSDESIFFDIDTPENWKQLVEQDIIH